MTAGIIFYPGKFALSLLQSILARVLTFVERFTLKAGLDVLALSAGAQTLSVLVKTAAAEVNGYVGREI
jgi:hypothetical protein